MARRKCARWSSSERLRPEISADVIEAPPPEYRALRGPGCWPPSCRGDERLVNEAILPAVQARKKGSPRSLTSCLVSMDRKVPTTDPLGYVRQRRAMMTGIEVKRARL